MRVCVRESSPGGACACVRVCVTHHPEVVLRVHGGGGEEEVLQLDGLDLLELLGDLVVAHRHAQVQVLRGDVAQ